jgi:hypothetical protein
MASTDSAPPPISETAAYADIRPAVISWWRTDTAILIYIAAATVLTHLLTGRQYGFQRDELATLDDARHLAWGYVAYPPITPFFGRLSLILFGTSLPGFRFFAAMAQAVAVVLTGLMAREMGGRRGAQFVAAAAAVPFCLGGGALMQYVSFDCLAWVLTAYCVVRLLMSDDQRWWAGIGIGIGLGMMAKYTMGFFTLGIVAAVILTPARRYLKSKWLWIGVALSILIWLPNLVWQAQNHFIAHDFLKFIHERDVRVGRTDGFLFPGQIKISLLAFPLAMTGLYFCLISREGRRLRMLGWMYIVPLVLFAVFKGRDYYFAPAYPMLYAAGSVFGERWLAGTRSGWATAVRTAAWVALVLDILLAVTFFLPVAPVNSAWGRLAFKLQGDYPEEIGWPELVQTVAQVRDALPEQDRARLGILAGNYGEAGAINLFGPDYGLPRAMSGINSFWRQGYGDPPPETLIVIGLSQHFVDKNFASCMVAGHTWNQYGVKNEETEEHPDIYVCRGLRESWPEFWKDFQYFG